MQTGNNTAPGSGGGGGRPTLDQIMFVGLQSNPAKMTSWTVLGATFVAMATGKILLDTGRYFEFFHHRDNKWMQMGVALGTTAACAHFGICIAQAWELSRHAFTDFHTVRRFESIGGNVSDLLGAFLNIAASSYYASRAYRMSGRKWWLGSFIMTFTTATFVMGTFIAIKGMTGPEVTMGTIMKLKTFNEGLIPLRKAWGALAMTSDGMIVVTMLFYLIKSRESVFHQEKRIYHKLIVLILETMLPPVICILILDVDGSKASPTADFRKPVKMLIPTLFYVSLLHSLVSRATIRQMLGTSLASNGMLKADIPTQAGESIFVAAYGGGETKSEGDVKERDLESGEVVVPAQAYRRDASPISHSSNKNPAF